MAARLFCCSVAVALLYGVATLSDAASQASISLEGPAEVIVSQFGMAVELPGTPADVLAKRWTLSLQGDTLQANDPASGLAVTQERCPLRIPDKAGTDASPGREFPARTPGGSQQVPDMLGIASKPEAFVVRTTLANRGGAELAVQNVCFVDWSFPIADSGDALRYRPLSHRNDLWYGSTFWTGPDWTRVGKDWHHPGQDTPSVRRFQTPRDGRVTITGRVRKAHLDGDGIRAWIELRGRKLWQTELAGKDSQGVEPNLALDVRRDDAIRFVVHKRGGIACDTTYWDPVVTYADGQRFQASTAFAANRQGHGGWFYEMEAGEADQTGLPQVAWFGRDLSLQQQSLGVDRKVEFSHRDAMPMIVVSDSADKSGIALALPPDAAWHFTASLAADGRLRLELAESSRPTPRAPRGGAAGASSAVIPAPTDSPFLCIKPGQTAGMPPVLAAHYRGPWSRGFAVLQPLFGLPQLPKELADLPKRVANAMEGTLQPRAAHAALKPASGSGVRYPDLDYWALIQSEWRQEDKLQDTAASYAAATLRHLEKARLLLADLRSGPGRTRLDAEAAELQRLAERVEQPGASADVQRSLYLQVRWLKRRIALANPLFPSGKLLFAKRVPTSYSHLVMQYFGWRARPGGGLFVLDEPGYSLACRDILAGMAATGNVLEPRLSWDAKRIVFSFVKCPEKKYDPNQLDNLSDDGFYHVDTVNVDGSGLSQLTSGPYDDLMPTWLPDGGIAFSSTRRRGYARCFGGQFSPRWHVYTLHRMDADGRNVQTLSFHDTNEWFPAVSPTGLILYARWDYIDRDAVTHQNLWATRPDGTNPVAVWGNATPTPHCSFQAQPIPGTSKIVITAAPHHSITAGSIAVVDPMAAKDGQEAITRITPEIPFPEAEGRNIQEYYSAPWPLSDKYFLVSYSPKPLVWEPGANDPAALGLYLLDAFGNRELVYRDAEIGCENACPIAPRPMPPVVASHLAEQSPAFGEMLLADVYQGLGDLPRGSIKQLRVVQIFPKSTHVADHPPLGAAREENGRAILGTVPVEADGSARFTVPAQRPLLFQALDQDGLAYQTMRTVTYVQPGEKVSCIGCHEHRMTAPPSRDVLALRRPASRIEPGTLGGRPFSFVEVVQPILDRHCVRCHGAEKREAKLDLRGTPLKTYTQSYLALCGDRDFWGEGTNPKNAAEALVPRFGGRNQIQVTPPGGMYGARGSRLVKLLRAGHYDAKLPADDLRALGAWIDLNAIFYGINQPADQARQLRGELVAMPEVQ